MSILVIDVGTSSVRAGIMHPDTTITNIHRRPMPPESPMQGLVEFDADAMAKTTLDVARQALADVGKVEAVGVTNQRSSAILWNASTGKALGPGLSWQDLRTVGQCIELAGEGFGIEPTSTATKVSWLLKQPAAQDVDPSSIRWGTVDSWIVWHLTKGEAHITDASNAGVTGLVEPTIDRWSSGRLKRLGIHPQTAPRIVDSTGHLAEATALPGSPPVCGIIGDQQASLVGQGCTKPGLAKITFGTGAMLDLCLDETRPKYTTRGAEGCYPIVAWQRNGRIRWGAEAIMMSAGSAVDWLVEDMGILSSAAESAAVAAQCENTGGVMAVPALVGLGAPYWDFGARGALLGFSRGTKRAHVVRAVLEGVAGRGAELLHAAEADSGRHIEAVRVDGGMSANDVFIQALANATGRKVEISPELEATARGAGLLAGMATGVWSDESDVASTWAPRTTVEPAGDWDKEKWQDAVSRARSWYPELSALSF